MTTTFLNISDDQLDVPVPTMNEIVAALAGELLSECIRNNGRGKVELNFKFDGFMEEISVRPVVGNGSVELKEHCVQLTVPGAVDILAELIKGVEMLGEVSA